MFDVLNDVGEVVGICNIIETQVKACLGGLCHDSVETRCR